MSTLWIHRKLYTSDTRELLNTDSASIEEIAVFITFSGVHFEIYMDKPLHECLPAENKLTCSLCIQQLTLLRNSSSLKLCFYDT